MGKNDTFCGLDGNTVEQNIESNQSIVDAFHTLYYQQSKQTWETSHWLGYPLLKNPLDLWIYQEIIFSVKPDLIIECGTYHGGSALYFASLLDLIGSPGKVVTIDVEQRAKLPDHSRISYLTGSSVSVAILNAVKSFAGRSERILVVLDSDHSETHVLRELESYSPMVSRGSYIIVEDSNINGNPVRPNWGPGPMEAIVRFLSSNKNFFSDRRCEKYFFTQNPKGFLKHL